MFSERRNSALVSYALWKGDYIPQGLCNQMPTCCR